MNQYYILIFVIALLSSCNDSKKGILEIDNHEVESNLVPGIGEYMVQLEYHYHAIKAAINDTNFKRVEFEINEMDEVFEKIEHFHNQHEKLKQPFSTLNQSFMMPVLHELRYAVSRKNVDSCLVIFNQLSSNCNACHALNDVGFIKVK